MITAQKIFMTMWRHFQFVSSLLFCRSWDSDLMSKVSKMVSPLLLMTLTMCLSSLGSLIQASHSLDYLDSVQVAHSTGRNNNGQDRLSSEVISHSRSSRESSASGQSADSKSSQTLVNRTSVTSKEPEPVGNKKHSCVTIPLFGCHTLTYTCNQKKLQNTH